MQCFLESQATDFGRLVGEPVLNLFAVNFRDQKPPIVLVFQLPHESNLPQIRPQVNPISIQTEIQVIHQKEIQVYVDSSDKPDSTHKTTPRTQQKIAKNNSTRLKLHLPSWHKSKFATKWMHILFENVEKTALNWKLPSWRRTLPASSLELVAVTRPSLWFGCQAGEGQCIARDQCSPQQV